MASEGRWKIVLTVIRGADPGKAFQIENLSRRDRFSIKSWNVLQKRFVPSDLHIYSGWICPLRSKNGALNRGDNPPLLYCKRIPHGLCCEEKN